MDFNVKYVYITGTDLENKTVSSTMLTKIT